MSNPPALIAESVIAGASVDALIATAHALVREAADKAGMGTVGSSRDELIDQIIACQQVQNSTWAAQSIRLAQVAAIEEIVEPGKRPREVRRPIGKYADEWLPAELATRLGWSDRQATGRLTDAVDGIRATPGMFELTVSGTLDARKLCVVADALAGAPKQAARQVESELLSGIDLTQDAECREPIQTTSTKLVRRARRLLAEVAPVDAERSAATQRANAKAVRVFPHQEPGMSVLCAVLPTDDAMRIMAGVNELARHLHQDTTAAKCLDECRVDAFADLILGNISVSTTCVVQVPILRTGRDAAGESVGETAVTDAAHGVMPRRYVGVGPLEGLPVLFDTMDSRTWGPAGEPARLSGSFVEAEVEQLLRLSAKRLDMLTTMDHVVDVERLPPPRPLASRKQRPVGSPGDEYRVGDAVVEGLGVIPAGVLAELCRALGTKVARALVDLKTGATVETADETYKPGARLRRFVVTRDEHCRFPGCTRPARLDDLDHVIRWPDGPTAASNLQCLCRHHHRAKHEGGWQVSMTADGTCTWTSPSGRRYVTHPAD